MRTLERSEPFLRPHSLTLQGSSIPSVLAPGSMDIPPESPFHTAARSTFIEFKLFSWGPRMDRNC